jgi:hypothetical protein
MEPFGSHDRAFDYYVIDLVIVLSPLPLVLKIQIGTSGDGVYSSKGWETGGLLGGFLILWWGWKWVIWLCLWLGCLRACGRIFYLQRCWRVSDCQLGCVDLVCVWCVIVWPVVL